MVLMYFSSSIVVVRTALFSFGSSWPERESFMKILRDDSEKGCSRCISLSEMIG